MLFLLIFPVLVAGFVACHIHPVHAYKLHRYEGQYLYLKSAELGLRCFAVAFLVALFLHFCLPDSISVGCYKICLAFSAWLTAVMKSMTGADDLESAKMAWFFILSAMSWGAAYIIKAWALVSLRLRFGMWDARVFVMGELLEDSPLDNLLFQLSLQKDKSIVLTMEDRKVYVGKVISLGEPTETNGIDQDVSIVPLMSGYRDKEDLRVHFNTYYDEIDSDIYLSLRQDAIVSATEFNFEAYQKWNPKDSKEGASKDSANNSVVTRLLQIVETAMSGTRP